MSKVWERTTRGAKRFAREVEKGRTYYTIETCNYPWGTEEAWCPWTFTKRSVLGSLMDGCVSAEAAVLRHGPMYDTKPGPQIRPMFERDATDQPNHWVSSKDKQAARR